MLTSRSGSQGASSAPPPQSIEAIRRRARHRLIGAAVLVLLGVLGFPMLFDTQPRPIAVDVPIEIPARNPAPSLPNTQAEAPTEKAPVAPAPAETAQAPAATVPTGDSLSGKEEAVTEKTVTESPRPEPSKPAASAAKAAPKSDAPAEPPAKDAKATAEADAARAKALLNDKPVAGDLRLVVQVGAFAEADRARETRLKLERAGLKTYTHVAETPQGKRIRVRLGPFSSRAEAEKAAARVKALGLPAAILTL